MTPRIRQDGVERLRQAHSYSWQGVSKVVGVVLPGDLPGTLPGQSSPASRSEAQKSCDQLGDLCGGISCVDLQRCHVRRGQGSDALRGAQAGRGFSQIQRFRADRADFAARTDLWWGYLVREKIAPVLLSEFGMAQEGRRARVRNGQDWALDPSASLWFTHLSAYIAEANGGRR